MNIDCSQEHFCWHLWSTCKYILSNFNCRVSTYFFLLTSVKYHQNEGSAIFWSTHNLSNSNIKMFFFKIPVWSFNENLLIFYWEKKVVLGNYFGFKVSKRRTYHNNNTRQLKTFITWGLAMAIKAVPTKCQVGLANEHCQVYLSWNSHNECTAVWSQPNSLANNFKREQLIAIHLWGECNKFPLEAANT